MKKSSCKSFRGPGRFTRVFAACVLTTTILSSGCEEQGAGQGPGTVKTVSTTAVAIAQADPTGDDTVTGVSDEVTNVRTLLPKIHEYMEGTSKASPGSIVLTVPLGAGATDLGGMAEDPEWVTDGFPPAYDVASDGSIHVLDSAKGRIAIFTGGKLSSTVDIGPISKPDPELPRHVLSDLSVGSAGGHALLDQTSGRIVITDASGAEKYFVEGLRGAAEICLTADGVLFVLIPWAGEEGKARVMRFDGEGTMTGMYEAHGLKPWPAGDFLYFLDPAEPPSLMRMSMASSASEKIASLATVDNHMYIHATPILGACQDGRVAVVLLMSRPLAPGSHDESQTYRKAVAIFSPDGVLAGHSDFPQPFVECKFTPRLHRLGGDGTVYTAIPRAGFYEIFKKPAGEFIK